LRGDSLREENGQFFTGPESFADFYYGNNSYVIRAKNGQGGHIILRDTAGKQRTSIKVDFSLLERSEGYVMLSYSDASSEEFYELAFDPDESQWNLRHYYRDGSSEYLIPWTYWEPQATEGAWSMELRLVDGIFYVLINDDFLGSIASPTFTSGYATFGCSLYADGSGGTYAAEFRDLRVFEIG
jgi:hypothetical protein